MKNAYLAAALVLPSLFTTGVSAQEDVASRKAVGVDVFASTDADDSEVVRSALNLDLHYRDQSEYFGIRLEKALFKPLGQPKKDRDRAFVRYADGANGWNWNTQIGADGNTVIGSASIHDNAEFRKEFFIERDIVETPRGLRGDGIYYTFAGAAIDLPVNDRNIFTVVAGAQEFTGDNVRLHARANYMGITAQLRLRYFHSSEPREFDYYSPGWYGQIIPVLQMRRYNAGWRYMIAGGVGGQRDSYTDWRTSYYAAAEITSPEFGKNWYFKASALYTNLSLTTEAYDYGQFMIGLTRSF